MRCHICAFGSLPLVSALPRPKASQLVGDHSVRQNRVKCVCVCVREGKLRVSDDRDYR